MPMFLATWAQNRNHSVTNGNVFIVKVKVDTFEGAHNNYYTEILVFTVTPTTVTLNDYSHSDFYK